MRKPWGPDPRAHGEDSREAHQLYATKFAGFLLLAAPAMGLSAVFGLGMALDGESALHYISVFLVAAVSAAIGVTFLLKRRPAPMWALNATPTLGTALTIIPIFITHAVTATGVLLLTWPSLFAGYLLPEYTAWGTLAMTIAAFSAAGAAGDVADPTRSSIELALTASVTLFVVIRLRRQAEQLREELALQARTDSLTGLANRRAFDEAVTREFARHLRTGQPLALIVADIDHFKSVNDTWGHAAGDDVLRKLGALLTGLVRPFDTVGRLGGEEFGLVLPDCATPQARARALELLNAIRQGSQSWEHPITVSLGVAVSPEHADSPSGLQARADAALYAAKAAGRDQVQISASAARAAWAGGRPTQPGPAQAERRRVPTDTADTGA